MKKSCATFIFLSHSATMAIDSANPGFLYFLRTSCYFQRNENYHLQTLSIWKRLKFVVWERVKTPIKYKVLEACEKFQWAKTTVNATEYFSYWNIHLIINELDSLNKPNAWQSCLFCWKCRKILCMHQSFECTECITTPINLNLNKFKSLPNNKTERWLEN